jgi:dTDP-4-amino-4,6-dideoxygalactose transaminase
MNNKIYFNNLFNVNNLFVKKFNKKYIQFIKSGNYILGDSVKQFEKKFSKFNGAKYCAGVGNGFDALSIAFKSLNLEKDSEVLIPSNAYIACILSVINAGLKPVLIEPNINTYNIDAKKIKEKISRNTKVILALHLYGKPCDIINIKSICNSKKLYLVEDCAQSHGASVDKKMVGTFGDFGCFSFYPTKNLGALGDGGALITNNNYFFNKIKKIRNYGSIKRYFNEVLGVNSRLDEFQASFLNIKLKYLKSINKYKKKLALIYNAFLRDDFVKPIFEKNVEDVFYIYNIRHIKRDKIKKYLLKNNIESDIHYPLPIYKQPVFKNLFKNQQFPISDEIHNTTLSLPISYATTEKEIYRIIKVLNNF